MANEVAVFNPAAVPAFAKGGQVSAMAKALAGSSGFGSRLSIKGGVFRLIVDGKEVSAIDERYLDVVFVAAAPKIGRTWYAKKFTDGENTGPSCWSSNGEKPDATSADMQAGTCASCDKNVKGSGEGDSRACRYSQRVAVVLANDIEGTVMQLSLPAKSIFGDQDGDKRPLQAYVKWLVAQNISPEQVITRLRFDTKEESPKLFFKTMRWLTPDEYETVLEQGKSKDALDAVTMTVAQADKAPAAETKAPEAPKATKPAPAPAEEDEPPAPPAAAPKTVKGKGKVKDTPPAGDDEPPAPEPTKREKPAAAEIPKKPGLAAVIADWDDDN